jgi:hypothetical protein
MIWLWYAQKRSIAASSPARNFFFHHFILDCAALISFLFQNAAPSIILLWWGSFKLQIFSSAPVEWKLKKKTSVEAAASYLR